MTKKATRRQIMEAVGYPDKRAEYHEDYDDPSTYGGTFTYIREGELLKVELEEVFKALDAWNPHYETQTKWAWRSHLRDAVGIEYEGWHDKSRFSLHELRTIYEEVRDDE